MWKTPYYRMKNVWEALYHISKHEQRICTYRGLRSLREPYHRTNIHTINHTRVTIGLHTDIIDLNSEGGWAKEQRWMDKRAWIQWNHYTHLLSELALSLTDRTLQWLHTGGHASSSHSKHQSIYFQPYRVTLQHKLALWSNAHMSIPGWYQW